MTDRKKPGVAFWATLAIAVMLVAYPLSVGPVLYVIARLPDPERAVETVWPAYRPLGALAEHSHDFWVVIRWYVNLWVEFPDFLD